MTCVCYKNYVTVDFIHTNLLYKLYNTLKYTDLFIIDCSILVTKYIKQQRHSF